MVETFWLLDLLFDSLCVAYMSGARLYTFLPPSRPLPLALDGQIKAPYTLYTSLVLYSLRG